MRQSPNNVSNKKKRIQKNQQKQMDLFYTH